MVKSGGTMNEFNIDNLMKEFISGDIDIENLSEVIDERLFILRQKPEITSEQELLSNLELYIHEAKEGYRSWDDLNVFILSIIERSISEQNSTTVILNTYANSELITVSRGAIPVKDYHLEFSLV